MELLYLVFTHMPGESDPRRLRSFLLCLCDVFRVLISSCVLFLLKTCFVQQIEVIKQKREIKDFVLKCSLIYIYVMYVCKVLFSVFSVISSDDGCTQQQVSILVCLAHTTSLSSVTNVLCYH